MTTHLIRKDWQARRKAIVVWIALFALCLLVQLNPMDLDSDPARDAGFVIILLLLPIVCLKFMLGIVGITIGEDSPVKRERFLATRPLPARTLWLSKALFIGLVVILPVALLTALFLAFASRDPRVVILGSLQMVLLATALTSFAAGFSSLWSARKETVLAIVTVGLVFGAFGLLGKKFLPTYWFDDLLTRSRLEGTTGLLVAGILLCGLASIPRVQRSSLFGRLGVLAFSSLAGLLLAAVLPLRHQWAGSGHPEHPVRVMNPAEVGHRFGWNEVGDRDPKLSVQLQLERPDSLEPDEDIDWLWRRLWVNGTPTENPFFHRQSLASQSGLHDTYRDSLRHRVEDQLGHAPTWVLIQDHHHSFDRMASVSAIFPGPEPGSTETYKLSADLSARVYRWECEAELPLASAGQAYRAPASWSVSYVSLPGNSSSYDISIVLNHSAAQLWISGGGGEKPQSIHTRYRNLTFLLHDPVRQRVFVGLEAFAQARGFLPTGFQQARVELRIPRDGKTSALLEESWPDLRLMVFRPQLVEQFERRWNSPRPLVPAHLPNPDRGGDDRRQDLSIGQFARRYELLDKPRPDAGSLDPFLDQVLALARRCERSVDDARNPWTRDLTELVPQHLGSFLERFRGLATNDYRERRLLLMAMQQGCLDEQSGQVAAAYAENLDLLPLILFRGWTAQVRPMLLEDFDYGVRSRDLLEALDRIDAFDDPHRRAMLLSGLRRRPDDTTYQILRNLEGAGQDLDDMVDRFVDDERPLLLPVGDLGLRRELDLILAHGRVEGVVELHGFASALKEQDIGERNELESRLDRFFEHRGISGAQRNDGETLINWFLERDPRRFRFDPVSRKFVWPTTDLP